MKINRLWVVIGMLILAGGLFTLADYKQYRFDETSKFGQGWKDLDRPAEELDGTYEDNRLGINFKYPKSWKIEKNYNSNAGDWNMVGVKVGEYLEVGAVKVNDRIEDVVNNRFYGKGAPMWSGDMEKINTGEMEFTVLTYQEELPGGKANVRQEAWGKKGETLVVVKAKVSVEDWSRLSSTVTEIYKNIAVL